MPMKAGNYYASLKEFGTGESNNANKTPYVYLRIALTHEADGAAWSDLDGKTERTIYIYTSERAWPTSQLKLAALGFNGKFDESMDFSVKEFEVVCEHEQYEGKTKERWELLSWGGGGDFEHKPLPKQTAMKLAAMWKNATAAPSKPTGKPPAPKAATKPVEAAPGEMPPVGDELKEPTP